MSMIFCPEEEVEEFSQPWQENCEVSYEPDKFLESVNDTVKNHLKAFFLKKSMYCGGPISLNTLHSKASLSTVINTDIEFGLKKAYAAMERDKFKQRKNEDIWFVISIFKKCADLGIPKCFRPGILLVYLELCEGIPVL